MIPKPLFDIVIVRPDQAPAGVPVEGVPRVLQGLAVEVGPGARGTTASTARMTVRRGDRVYYSSNAGALLEDEGNVFLLIPEHDLLAVARSDDPDEVPLWVAPQRKSGDS